VSPAKHRSKKRKRGHDETHEVTAAVLQEDDLEEETERDGDNGDDEEEQSLKVNRCIVTHPSGCHIVPLLFVSIDTR